MRDPGSIKITDLKEMDKTVHQMNNDISMLTAFFGAAEGLTAEKKCDLLERHFDKCTSAVAALVSGLENLSAIMKRSSQEPGT